MHDITYTPDGRRTMSVSLTLDADQLDAFEVIMMARVLAMQSDLDTLRFRAEAAELRQRNAEIARYHATIDQLVACREILETAA